jgi:hypothetical protein
MEEYESRCKDGPRLANIKDRDKNDLSPNQKQLWSMLINNIYDDHIINIFLSKSNGFFGLNQVLLRLIKYSHYRNIIVTSYTKRESTSLLNDFKDIVKDIYHHSYDNSVEFLDKEPLLPYYCNDCSFFNLSNISDIHCVTFRVYSDKYQPLNNIDTLNINTSNVYRESKNNENNFKLKKSIWLLTENDQGPVYKNTDDDTRNSIIVLT